MYWKGFLCVKVLELKVTTLQDYHLIGVIPSSEALGASFQRI